MVSTSSTFNPCNATAIFGLIVIIEQKVLMCVELLQLGLTRAVMDYCILLSRLCTLLNWVLALASELLLVLMLGFLQDTLPGAVVGLTALDRRLATVGG